MVVVVVVVFFECICKTAHCMHVLLFAGAAAACQLIFMFAALAESSKAEGAMHFQGPCMMCFTLHVFSASLLPLVCIAGWTTLRSRTLTFAPTQQ